MAVAAAGGGTDVLVHVAFGGGAAATAYAYRRGMLASGRAITTPLMGLDRPDVLAVGGCFGMLGYGLNAIWQLIGIAPWTDSIALTVVVSAMIARLAFGRSGLASKRFTPDERSNWVRHQERAAQCATIGLGVGLVSAFLALTFGAEHGGDVFGFGIAASSLLFAQFGMKIPVTHHMALSAAAAALATGNVFAGTAFGMIGGLRRGRLLSRLSPARRHPHRSSRGGNRDRRRTCSPALVQYDRIKARAPIGPKQAGWLRSGARACGQSESHVCIV